MWDNGGQSGFKGTGVVRGAMEDPHAGIQAMVLSMARLGVTAVLPLPLWPR